MSERKRIPYLHTNFEAIRTEGYLYVDKTRFIEMLEKEETKYHFLIRPRKFGKTLFASVLEYYYDLRFADKFQQLFGDLYIGKNPTKNANKLFVLFFDFSGIDTSSIQRFDSSLNEKIKIASERFLNDHEDIIENVDDLVVELRKLTNVSSYLDFLFSIIQKQKSKAYVIIDEYDHFANDMIAEGKYLGEDIYKKTVWAGSQVRDFYETLKANSRNVIEKIFITGITPIVLDDLTSGFNISYNLSLKEKYNDILGFTNEEVELIIKECGIDKSLINNDIEYLYDGYKFHANAKNRLYNSTMIFNYFHELKEGNGKVENLVDPRLKTDYGRLRRLIRLSNNKEKVRELIDNKFVSAKIMQQFSIETINDYDNFFSLLFYMGLLTIDNSDLKRQRLKIPNYSVQTMFWEYIEQIEKENNPDLFFDNSKIISTLETFAYDNDPKPFLDYFQQNILGYMSNRDMQNFSEKNIKVLLLGILFQSNLYLPISETENSKGYTDIYLQKRSLYPVDYEWVLELKYVKTKDSKKQDVITQKQNEAKEQLQSYKNSNLFKDRADIRYLSIVFIGKKEYIIEEI